LKVIIELQKYRLSFEMRLLMFDRDRNKENSFYKTKVEQNITRVYMLALG